MLEIRALRKSFGSVIAADDIDLSVAPGEALGIIGPNGAGKTTLFNLIAGGLAPDAGEIRLNGRNITAATPHERRARTSASVPEPVPTPCATPQNRAISSSSAAPSRPKINWREESTRSTASRISALMAEYCAAKSNWGIAL